MKEKTKVIAVIIAGILIVTCGTIFQLSKKEKTVPIQKTADKGFNYEYNWKNQVPMDLKDPAFEKLETPNSQSLKGAWYAKNYTYMVLSVNGLNLSFCNITQDQWAEFKAAESLDEYYNSKIKGIYECRAGEVAGYQ